LIDNPTSPLLVCPACKGSVFTVASTGMFIIKTINKCSNCGTELERKEKMEKRFTKSSRLVRGV
jgi:DNA-directed RNA polymerase subunit RPC12/RpoP